MMQNLIISIEHVTRQSWQKDTCQKSSSDMQPVIF